VVRWTVVSVVIVIRHSCCRRVFINAWWACRGRVVVVGLSWSTRCCRHVEGLSWWGSCRGRHGHGRRVVVVVGGWVVVILRCMVVVWLSWSRCRRSMREVVEGQDGCGRSTVRTDLVTDPSPAKTGTGMLQVIFFSPVPIPWYPVPVTHHGVTYPCPSLNIYMKESKNTVLHRPSVRPM